MKRLAASLSLCVLLGLGCSGWLDSGPEPVIYVVEKGDSLWGIAKAHDVSVDEVRQWNGLDGDRIEVGQELQIFVAGTEADGAVAKDTPKGRRGRRSGSGSTGKQSPSAGGGSATAGLSLPPEKPCLSGPSLDAEDAEDEASFAASAGLSRQQVRAGMNGVVQHTLRCVPEGTQPTGTMDLRITVGCNGRVSGVEVVDDGGLPGELVSCVPDVLAYGAFDSHDLPDGETFEYPLSFAWD